MNCVTKCAIGGEKHLLQAKICFATALRVDFVPLLEIGESYHERNGKLAAERVHS